MNNYKMLIKVSKATTICMYIAHWNIFVVNKRDLQKKRKKKKKKKKKIFSNHNTTAFLILISYFIKIVFYFHAYACSILYLRLF